MPHSHEPLLADFEESIARFEQALEIVHRNPLKALEIILSTLSDDIRALRPRVQAIGAAFSTDIATAVAAQKAADDQANAQNVSDLNEAKLALAELQGDIAAAETAGGITPPVAPDAPAEQPAEGQ